MPRKVRRIEAIWQGGLTSMDRIIECGCGGGGGDSPRTRTENLLIKRLIPVN